MCASPWIVRAEAIACGLMVAWFVCLLAVGQTHMGPLWRDEINTKWMSLRSGPVELWRYMCYDSFPVAWYLIVRGWIEAGLAPTDAGFRWLGACVALGLVGAALWAARQQGKRLPLLFIALFLLSSVLLRFGTSLRAYGMGVLTMLLMIGHVVAYVDRPGRARLAYATIATLLAVHTIYYNSAILAVLCGAGVATLLVARRWRAAGALALLGGVACASVLPYILGPLHRAGTWGSFIRADVTLGMLLERCRWTIDASHPGLVWGWIALALGVYAGCAWGLLRWHSPRRRRRALFILLAMPLLAIVHFRFLMTLSILTQPWYYITFLGFMALLIDRGADLFIRRHAIARAAPLLAAAAIVLFTSGNLMGVVQTRMSDMDLVAQSVTASAGADDYVLIQPWHLGISFEYFYRGVAPWSTIPSLTDLHTHRVDLVRDSLMNPQGAQVLVDRVGKCLDAGGRVWYIGHPQLPPPGRMIRPIPTPLEVGGGISPADTFWAYHIGYEMVKRGAKVTRVDPPTKQLLSDYEAPPLYRIEVERK